MIEKICNFVMLASPLAGLVWVIFFTGTNGPIGVALMTLPLLIDRFIYPKVFGYHLFRQTFRQDDDYNDR